MIDKAQARLRYPNIPATILEALYAYVEHRQQPGHFLNAVLSNNLLEAVQRADSQSQAALREIVEFVYNNLPSNSYGSYRAVSAWLMQPTTP